MRLFIMIAQCFRQVRRGLWRKKAEAAEREASGLREELEKFRTEAITSGKNEPADISTYQRNHPACLPSASDSASVLAAKDQEIKTLREERDVANVMTFDARRDYENEKLRAEAIKKELDQTVLDCRSINNSFGTALVNIAAKDRLLAEQAAVIATLGKVDPERVAQMIAHRCVGGNEHNALDKFHGYCAVCLVPWPCEYVGPAPKPEQEKP